MPWPIGPYPEAPEEDDARRRAALAVQGTPPNPYAGFGMVGDALHALIRGGWLASTPPPPSVPREQFTPGSPAQGAEQLRTIPPAAERAGLFNALGTLGTLPPTPSPSQGFRDIAAWDPLSGAPVPESMLTGGPFSTGAMTGVLGRVRRPIPAPNEPALAEAYAGGQGHPWWYGGAPEAFQKMYGRAANLSRGFNAILSQQKNPTEQARLANQALRLLEEYGIGGLERMPVMGSQKKELQGMADFFKFNPEADLAQALSPTSLKRRDYYWTFGGRGDRPVIDRHMGDILYPPGEFKGATGARMVELYTNASDITNVLAQRAGVPGAQYQGAAWIGHRLAKGLTKDNEPFAEILRRVGESSPDYQWLLKQGRLQGVSPAGLRNLQIVLPLAGLALAGVLGPGSTSAEAEPAGPRADLLRAIQR
jgi:hypothetical protein